MGNATSAVTRANKNHPGIFFLSFLKRKAVAAKKKVLIIKITKRLCAWTNGKIPAKSPARIKNDKLFLTKPRYKNAKTVKVMGNAKRKPLWGKKYARYVLIHQ